MENEFKASTGLEFGFLFALYEGATGLPATADDVENYASYIGSPDFPIFADGDGVIKGATPMTQEQHPEMCGISPELEILECDSGHGGYEGILDTIREHAGL